MSNRCLSQLAKRIGVSRLANVTGLDTVGLPVVAAVRPMSRNLTVCFGKGRTLELAQTSALLEAAELFFSETPHVPTVLSAYSALPADGALDPEIFATIGLPQAGLREVEFEWVQGRNLTTGQPVLVPWQTISMDLSAMDQSSRRLDYGATGLAAGFDPARAALHALYEVVERDCHQTWNDASDEHRERTLVEVESIRDPDIIALFRALGHAGLQVLLWDMTGPCGVPCYLAELFDPRPAATTAYTQGAAADVNTGRAIWRALSEAVQVRLTYISGGRDDLEHSDYGARYDVMVENRVWIQENLKPHRTVAAVAEQVLPSEETLSGVSARIRKSSGQDPVIVTLTPAEELVTVVKAVVPSFRDLPDVIVSSVRELGLDAAGEALP